MSVTVETINDGVMHYESRLALCTDQVLSSQASRMVLLSCAFWYMCDSSGTGWLPPTLI